MTSTSVATPGVALVVGRHRRRLELACPDGAHLACPLPPAGRMPALVVGDRVRIVTKAGSPRVTAVEPRRTSFARRDPGARTGIDLIAANLDLIVAVVSAAQPQPRWGLLDRLLVSAAAGGLEALVCVTKCDLAAEEELRSAITPYRLAGYQVFPVTAPQGQGLDALRAELRGRLALLAGPSGVGKTSLAGALAARTGLRTGAVNARTGKGRCTTAEIEAHPFEGGWLFDAPGLRAFGLPDLAPAAIADGFPEVRAARAGCRFGGGCTHVHEPGCTVKAAVHEGRFDPRRYRSYLRMQGGESDAGERGAGRQGGGESRAFVCLRCSAAVPGAVPGSAHRNHCPACLWSRHVDHLPGDRSAGCEGAMEPIAVTVRSGGEWAVIHRCAACGALRSNRIAGDDNAMLLLSLASRPLARPPFPLERLTGLPV